MENFYTIINSPLGEILLSSNGTAITGVYLSTQAGFKNCQQYIRNEKPFAEAIKQFDEYFAGTRQDFDLQLAINGTDFQNKIWQQLQQIPYGKTYSYKQLADAVNKPKASRAAGSANGKNIICIIIPCHRVISSNGQLGGYNGGLDAKTWLLAHEQKHALLKSNKLKAA